MLEPSRPSRVFTLITDMLKRQMTHAAFGLFITTVAVQHLHAQIVTPSPAGPNTVVGVVVDTSDIPLADVTVMFRALNRQTRTKSDGTFRFDSLPSGTHEISARSVGLIVGVQKVVVGSKGAAVRIMMIRFGTELASVVTTASRGGLSGVIGDTAYRAILGATIKPIGGTGLGVTDSLGAFFMPLRPGRYLLRIEKEGYLRQTIGISIPETEGRRIAAWLRPQVGPKDHMMAQQLFDLNEKMLRVSPISSKFLSREDLEQRGIVDMQALAIRYRTGLVSADCLVKIGGTYNTRVPLGNLTASDIEFVEVHLPTKIGSTRSGTSINGNPTKFTTPTFPKPSTSKECGNVGLIAWLRN